MFALYVRSRGLLQNVKTNKKRTSRKISKEHEQKMHRIRTLYVQ